MEGFVYFLLVVACVLAVWNLISPQSAWRALIAWQFKDPSAHEPSEAAHRVSRVASVFALVAAMAVGAIFSSAMGSVDSSDSDADYQACLERERAEDDGEGLLGPEDWCKNLAPDDAQDD